MSQINILFFLYEHRNEYYTRIELCKHLNLKKSTVSHETKKLIKDDYVEEYSPDGKYGCKPLFLKITEKGIKETERQKYMT